MHAVVIDSLEEYLSGTLNPTELREIETHLASCPACVEEIDGMRDVATLFGSLRTDEVVDPHPAFYAKVLQQIGNRREAPAGWFGLDLAFGRRLVFASLVVLAVMGSYLVTHEANAPSGPTPVAIMAQQNGQAFLSARAEDNMLVTLTAYEQ